MTFHMVYLPNNQGESNISKYPFLKKYTSMKGDGKCQWHCSRAEVIIKMESRTSCGRGQKARDN